MSKIEVNTIEPQCGTTLTVGKADTNVAVPSNVVKSNALQASDAGNIIKQCGTTVTLGASGDTVTLASGASQTGFGRTGTVDWNTTPVTSTPTTGVSGNGYFLNTTSGILTVNLPASPSAGDIMAVADYAGTAATNNITIGRNGSNIEGGTTVGTISTNRETKTLIYVDGTQGWVPVNDNFDALITPAFIVATGGTPCSGAIVCTNYKTHTFTGPGTLCVSCAGNAEGSNTVDYMVVAGGGGGGATEHAGNNRAGGAGAGGYRESSGTASGCYTVSPLGACVAALPVSATPYAIAVGSGGTGVYGGVTSGQDSSFSTITATGGGSGGECSPSPTAASRTGGSGGGASARGSGAAGNTPPVSPPQGQNGAASTGFAATGGGGGGAGAVGALGVGGAGVTSSIDGTPTTRGGGGGGPGSEPGAGGSGGGGSANGGAGTINTGGGGAGNYGPASTGGTGGSGIVVIRYKFQ